MKKAMLLNQLNAQCALDVYEGQPSLAMWYATGLFCVLAVLCPFLTILMSHVRLYHFVVVQVLRAGAIGMWLVLVT